MDGSHNTEIKCIHDADRMFFSCRLIFFFYNLPLFVGRLVEYFSKTLIYW